MCTLAIYFQAAGDCPVVIAANRDEFLERPAGDPTTLLENPHVVGGKDLKAGGTWLGIRDNGIVAAFTEMRRGEKRQPGEPYPRSAVPPNPAQPTHRE